MTYETLGDSQSIVPLKTFAAVVTWQLRCHMSFVGECNNTAVFLFHFSVCPFASPLPAFNELLGYEEKRQIHRSFEKKNLQVHMDPQGQPIIGYFSCGSLSISHPSLLGKLEIGVKVYTVPHAARWHCLPVNRQSHRRKIKEKREGYNRRKR